MTKTKTPSPSFEIVVKPNKPASALSNDVTWLASSFVSGLGVKDPRFDLACYGNFLPELPKRFGTHPALDASASALICAYPAVYNRKPSCEALTRYGKALHVLRLSLEKPGEEKVVEVLCAIYFLLICQVWRVMLTLLMTLTKFEDMGCKTRRRDHQPWQSGLTNAERRGRKDSQPASQRRFRASGSRFDVYGRSKCPRVASRRKRY